MNYSKVMELKDYEEFSEHLHIQNIRAMLPEHSYRWEHEHRSWEYGIVLNALRKNDTKSVLEIGGGGSLFAPSAVWLGMEVVQVDPSDSGMLVAEQARALKYPLAYIQKDFLEFETRRRYDAVVAISVIEHVEEYHEFFVKACSYVKPGGLLAITTDFHISGEAFSVHHLRTYNWRTLLELFATAKERGFDWFEATCNYQGASNLIYDEYDFASMILQRASNES